jgi:hypothetical protein
MSFDLRFVQSHRFFPLKMLLIFYNFGKNILQVPGPQIWVPVPHFLFHQFSSINLPLLDRSGWMVIKNANHSKTCNMYIIRKTS